MKKRLKKILHFLEKNHINPNHIDITQVANKFFVSSYNDLNSNFISESIGSGASYNKEIAVIKSLTEYIERKISKDVSQSFKNLGIHRSDGFAAFPRYDEQLDAFKICQQNAFHEAFERYSWANWWDTHDFSFSTYDNLQFSSIENDFFYSFLIKNFDLEDLFFISPNTSLDAQSRLYIALAKIQNFGYVTGGAAGFCNATDDIICRAFSELTRHLMAFNKMKSSSLENLSFYEKRLLSFANGENNALVEKRLLATGAHLIHLPELMFNNYFEHEFADEFVLHRCLFLDQPPFMGGEMNRLCL